MTAKTKSSLTVQYDLRTAKQVERRMFVDTFQRLAHIGFPIRNYQYTGFGSIYFIDFILFHKLLGIEKMLSIEHDVSIEDRVRFNCPFDCVEIVMEEAKDVIPTLSIDLQHILWLDFDYPINGSMLNDVYLAASRLPRASILILTVDVEPPDKHSEDPKDSKAYFESEAGDYLGLCKIADFTKSRLPQTSKRILYNAIAEGMAGRTDVDFLPLFYFIYADGHKMMTIGGMIGSAVEKNKLKSLDTKTAFYMRIDPASEPYHIIVPKLTRKERSVLDSAMPCDIEWQPNDFVLHQESIKIYREIYRFLPAYAELLV